MLILDLFRSFDFFKFEFENRMKVKKERTILALFIRESGLEKKLT